MCVDFGKYVLVAHDVREVSCANLAGSSQSVGIDGASGEEGGNGGIRMISVSIGAAVLLLAPLLFLLKLLGRIDDAGCNATECPPYYRTGTERFIRILAGQRDQRIAAPFPASHGVGKTKDVGNRVTGIRVTKAQRTGGETAREELAAQCADGRSSQKGVVCGVGRAAQGEIGENMRVARGVRRDGRRMEGVGKRGMRMRVVCAVVIIAMITAAGVNQFSGPQHGAGIIALAVTVGGSRGACRKLFAHTLRQGEATAGASIAVGASDTVCLLGFRSTRLRLEEIRMILDLGRFGTPIGGLLRGRRGTEFFAQAMGGDGVVRSRRGIIGGDVGMFGVALRTGEREDLGADDRGRAMYLAKMRQRENEIHIHGLASSSIQQPY